MVLVQEPHIPPLTWPVGRIEEVLPGNNGVVRVAELRSSSGTDTSSKETRSLWTTNLADYWKSLDKKFCEFCKCWIANNKPSVQFHESGKRHKDNVARKITDIQRKSAKDQREKAKFDLEIKKVEAAAMRSYLKDMTVNPDFSSQQMMHQLVENGQDLSSIPIPSMPDDPRLKKKTKQEKKAEKKARKERKRAEEAEKAKKKFWYESLSSEGKKFYWNIQTNATIWVKPEEYVTLEEQQREVEAPYVRAEFDILEKQAQIDDVRYQDPEELRCFLMRQQMKKKFAPPPAEKESHWLEGGPILESEPIAEPYGQWKTVEKTVQYVDLQLPKQEFVEIKVPANAEPRVRIKEKRVESLDDVEGGSTASFKKRKPNANRMNIRRRLSDDE